MEKTGIIIIRWQSFNCSYISKTKIKS